MTDLIKRLESAEAGSRLLDREVERAVGLHKADLPYGIIQTTSPVTTDLSAAVALVERVLPDCNWQVHKHGFAGISLKGHGGMYVGVSSDCVLSLCLALLQALKAKEHV
jgi:hypothetical protein